MKLNDAWVKIIVALIAATGAIVAGYLSIRSSTEPVIIEIGATQTAEAKESILTQSSQLTVPQATDGEIAEAHIGGEAQISITNTPSPEDLLASPLSVGDDFSLNCISAEFWDVYDPYGEISKDVNGCWQLSNRGLMARKGNLQIVADPSSWRRTGAINTAVSQSTTINMVIRVDKIYTPEEQDVNVVVGIGTADEWFYSGKFIVIRAISPDSPIYIRFSESVFERGKYLQEYTLGTPVHISFSLDGGVLSTAINDQLLEPVALLTSDDLVLL